MDGLKDLTKLTSLKLVDCDSLQNVDGLTNCTSLISLDLSMSSYKIYDSTLQNVDALANLTKLTSLNLEGCSSLQNVDGLANLTKLNSLDLWECVSLQNLDGLTNCTNLKVTICQFLADGAEISWLPPHAADLKLMCF